MDRLKALIIYFVKNFPRTLGRTELVKLVYYFEYSHNHLYNTQFTGTEFIREKRGPFSWDIPNTIDNMSDIISVHTYRTYYGDPGYRHEIRDINEAQKLIETLPSYVIDLAENVIEVFRGKGYKDFLKIVYGTPPMTKILSEEKQFGGKLIGRDVNMSEKSGIYKPTKDKLKAAKQRLNMTSRGSDEDYNQHFAEQIDKYQDVRRRATKCLLN